MNLTSNQIAENPAKEEIKETRAKGAETKFCFSKD
jgi:hypothetical protein